MLDDMLALANSVYVLVLSGMYERESTANHGTARHITAQHGTARHIAAQHGTARQGTTPHGTARR